MLDHLAKRGQQPASLAMDPDLCAAQLGRGPCQAAGDARERATPLGQQAAPGGHRLYHPRLA
eukprot:9132009-Prorocentrum_lima.AAC.1